MAELVDAHDSGSCTRKCVEVRVFSSAPTFQFLWVNVFLEPYGVVNVDIAFCLGLIR